MRLKTTSAIVAAVTMTLLSSSAQAQYIHGPIPNHPVFIHGGIPWMFGAPLPVEGPLGPNKTFDEYEWPVSNDTEWDGESSEKELFFPDGFIPFLGAPPAPGTEPRFTPEPPSDEYCAIKDCSWQGDTPQPPTPQPPTPQSPTPQQPTPDFPQPPSTDSNPGPDTDLPNDDRETFTPNYPDLDNDRPDIDIVNVVPEPSTYALMGAGLLGLGVAARRRRK